MKMCPFLSRRGKTWHWHGELLGLLLALAWHRVALSLTPCPAWVHWYLRQKVFYILCLVYSKKAYLTHNEEGHLSCFCCLKFVVLLKLLASFLHIFLLIPRIPPSFLLCLCKSTLSTNRWWALVESTERKDRSLTSPLLTARIRRCSTAGGECSEIKTHISASLRCCSRQFTWQRAASYE